MKSLIRSIASYSFSLFLLTQILPGVKISGGFTSYVLGGAVLAIMFMVLKPILSLLTFPINLITLGVSSFFVNAVILYLLTIVVPNISVSSFKLSGFTFAGFVVPSLSINTFFAYLFSSFLLSFFVSILTWLVKR